MYKILFVEDEDIIRTGLKKIVADAGIKFEAILEASCGKDALEIIKECSPEIVITDIRMPKMDGLELIRHCRSMGLNMYFIVVSGYGEFEYAQKAIAFGVTNYLLKPIKKKELIDSINSIILKLESNEEQKKRINDLQKESVHQVLKGKYKPEEIPSILKNVSFEFLGKSFMVLSYYYKHEIDTTVQDKVSKMVCSQFQKPLEPIISYELPYSYSVILIRIDVDIESELDSFLSSINTMILKTGRELKLNLYVGLSNISNDIRQLHNLVLQSEDALDYRLFYYERRLFHYKDIPKAKSSVHISDIYYDTLLNAVVHGRINETINSIDNLFRFILKTDHLTPYIIMNTFEELLHEVEKAGKKNAGSNRDNATDNGEYHTERLVDIYRSSDSISALITNIKVAFLNTGRNSLNDKGGHSSNAIENALKYIEEYYKKDLSVAQVSNHICMNPNYFSSLFKAKTGFSFTHYLQKLRVEKAKQLLSDPKIRIFEIAEMVGFENQKYFFKVFKKETGITPGEYRDNREA